MPYTKKKKKKSNKEMGPQSSFMESNSYQPAVLISKKNILQHIAKVS